MASLPVLTTRKSVGMSIEEGRSPSVLFAAAIFRRKLMPPPTLSVIIPAYRAEKTIRRAIDSVLQQTHLPDQIIVVDDGSPDNQNDIVAGYGPPVSLIRQTNSRTAAARNTGIDHAHGEIIAFLDADDYWEPDKLSRQIDIFGRYSNVGLVAGGYHVHSPGDASDVSFPASKPEVCRPGPSRWYDRVCRETGARGFLLGTMLWTGTVAVRRKTLADERFVSGLEPAEDRDLWVRLVSRSDVYLISHPLANCVLENDSISRSNIARDCMCMLQVIDRRQATLGVRARSFWRAYVYYRWAALEPIPKVALPLLIRSFMIWPGPLVGIPQMQVGGRLRRLVRLLRLHASPVLRGERASA